jgi:hypothetical protein
MERLRRRGASFYSAMSKERCLRSLRSHSQWFNVVARNGEIADKNKDGGGQKQTQMAGAKAKPVMADRLSHLFRVRSNKAKGLAEQRRRLRPGEMMKGGEAQNDVLTPPHGLREVPSRIVGGGRIDETGEHRCLQGRQLAFRPAKISLSGSAQSIIAVAEISHLGIHAQNVAPRIRQVQLDCQDDLLEIDEEAAALVRRIEHFGKLLIDRSPTVACRTQTGGPQDNVGQGNRINPDIDHREKALVLGRDQRVDECSRRKRSGIYGVAPGCESPCQPWRVIHIWRGIVRGEDHKAGDRHGDRNRADRQG